MHDVQRQVAWSGVLQRDRPGAVGDLPGDVVRLVWFVGQEPLVRVEQLIGVLDLPAFARPNSQEGSEEAAVKVPVRLEQGDAPMKEILVGRGIAWEMGLQGRRVVDEGPSELVHAGEVAQE